MPADAPEILPAALLFDMDGTLTEPLLDFPLIKSEMGIGNRPILEALAEMDDATRRDALAILHRHEEDAATRSTLNPGCRELLQTVSQRNIGVALITRNSLTAVRTVFDLHGLAMDVLITRDDAPPKPHPQPLLLACRRLGVQPQHAWMVGDGQYDIEAANAASIRSVWVSHGRKRDFSATPWRQVRDLWELSAMLCEA